MLRLVIVDSSAESRNKIAARINGFASKNGAGFTLLPRISVKPLAVGELKLHSPPDICIIGDEYLSGEPNVVASIRKILPQTALLGLLPRTADALLLVEQLAQLGLSDCFTFDTTALEFFQKVILLVKRVKEQSRGGKLILVDSGKGGVGVTTVAAAMADALALTGINTVLLDLDSDSQDASRFLQARPFVNENLQQLLDGSKTLSEESVAQCLVPLWDEESLFCMAPPPLTEQLHDPNSGYQRGLLSILEVLDESHDVVVVDAGGAPALLMKALYRAADHVVFVINNDPASLFSSSARALTYRKYLSPQARFTVVENGSRSGGLTREVLQKEFTSAARLDDANWVRRSIPWSSRVLRWPASGLSPLGIGGSAFCNSVFDLLRAIGMAAPEQASQKSRTVQVFSRNLLRTLLPFSRRLGESQSCEPEKPIERIDARTSTRALPQTLSLPSAQDLFRSAELKSN